MTLAMFTHTSSVSWYQWCCVAEKVTVWHHLAR